ncbi:hypothetical protein [Pantoea cypripedii]|uniref:Uncharacterized protein n=1 Tax=Pantoea cypripedii TaxID=55209 RepID=A0A1X1EXY9_PANCY|nr:hypothetical protein [Pantoea cypripedii]ORM94900.1 hypothetical protein HA50_16740 [Pantoea cypripedii]
MTTLGDWSEHDNKKYVGKIDRIYVSMTEEYEVEYFIDHYLQSRNYQISNENRDIVTDKLEAYPGKAPFKRDDLNTYLDKLFNK